jgi:hypothetical protein
MTMRRLMVAVALTMAVVTATVSVPRRAAAVDNLVYIIPAALGGAVALALIIAIVMTNRKGETDFELTEGPPRASARGGVQLAPHCPPTADGLPLLCW